MNVLAHVVLIDDEITAPQIRDGAALAVDHADIELNQIGLDLDHFVRVLPLRFLRAHRGSKRRGEKQENQCRNDEEASLIRIIEGKQRLMLPNVWLACFIKNLKTMKTRKC